MAELNIRVNTQQAAVGAKAFEKMINDIKAAARSLDQQNLTQFGGALRTLTSSGANLLAMVNQIADSLGRMNYSLQSIRAANHGTAMANDFGKLRDVVRETRAQITGLNTELKEAVTLAGRMGTASQRVRRARAPAADTAAETAAETAAVMSTALVPATTRALTVFQAFRPVASSITLVTTAVSGLAREMRLLTSGAESADRSMRQLVTTTQRAHATMQQFRVTPGGETARMGTEFYGVGRPPLQLGPGGMGQAGAMTPYQRPPSEPIITPQPGAGIIPIRRRGVEAEILQGEIVDRYGKALMNVQQPLMATSKAVENAGKEFEKTKEKKDRLDRNLKDTAQNTLPKFNSAWLVTIGYFALFQTRRIIDELTDLGKALFKTGEDFEKIFALFKAGAGDDIEEGARRMQVAGDTARKYGLDLAQTADNFARVEAAAKGSSAEGAIAEQMAKNLSAAQAVFGQSTEKGIGLIKVFTDVLGKGRLQSEELVKQLGNAVPGAFRVVADSVGMTTTQLQDAVAKGSLDVVTVLSKLAEELNRRYGQQALNNINRLGGAFNNLKTSITEVSLLIVNMSTGLMMGGGGNFGQALIASFKQLSDLLQNREIQARIVELANFITNVLSAAFQGLIVVLQFVTEHMQAFIGVITFLTSAAVVMGVTALGLAFKGLFVAFIGFAATGPGAVIMIAGLAASLLLGYKAAEMFGKATEGVADAMKKMRDDQEKLRQQAAPGNKNPADQTRAVQEALNRVETEQRRFVEGVRGEAQMLELAAAGVSTLGAKYEAYLNVLERIKSQEIKQLFEILSPQDAATMKRRLTEALLAAETVKQAIGDIVGMFKSLDQEREKFVEAQMSMTESLRAVRGGTFSEAGQQIQEQYDQKVLPVMRRVREELRSIADPNLRNTLVGAFNAWSAAMRDNIVQLKIMQGVMGGIGEITRSLQDFRIEKMVTDLRRGVKDGEVFVDTTKTAMTETVKNLLKEGVPDLKPPNVRTLGGELSEGFNPQEVGREMGLTFTEVFVRGMEESVQKLINEMKTMAAPSQGRPGGGGGTGGPYLPKAGEYQGLFQKGGAQYKVDPELAARFAYFESGFEPGAVATDPATGKPVPGGGRGMMQFIPSTQRKLGLSDADIFDPEKNVMAGFKLLDQLLTEHKGDLEKVVYGYRGKTRAEVPKYFEDILGGYTGTGRIPAGAVAAPAVAESQKTEEAVVAAEKTTSKVKSWWQSITGIFGRETLPADRPTNIVKSTVDKALGFEKPGEAVPAPAPAPAPAPPPVATPGVPKSEDRAKQTAEETAKIKEQVEAIRKRNEAIQAQETQTKNATAAQDRMNAQTQKQKDELAALQVEIDQTVALLDKQVVSTTNLGTVLTSQETIDKAQEAGARAVVAARRQYVGITDQMLEQINRIAQAGIYNQAVKQGDEFIRNIERQTKAIKEETAALSESPLTKEASALARQRQREAETSNAAFSPEQLAERQKAIAEEVAATRDKAFQTYLEGSEKEQRALQMEIESLNDNTFARAANLEMRKANDELTRNAVGMSEDQKRRLMESNEATRQTRIALQQANGPLRQYIDGLADFSSQATISNAIQQNTAELFKGVEDSIISFAKTGKLSFSELADSFIESIQRMVLQALILRPIMEALNEALAGGSGGAGGGSGVPGAGMSGAGKAVSWFSTLLGLAGSAAGLVGGGGTTPTVAGSTGRTLDIPQVAAVASRVATGGWVTLSGIQHFQGGGMASVGTDTVPAMLTPGEMVLNKDQQNSLFGQKDSQQNNTFNMVFPNVSNEDQARKTAAQAYSEISSRLERQRVRDGVRTRK